MGRILAISDIHGQADALQSLLKFAQYDATQDELYLLGDYIGKGPQSEKTVKLVQTLLKNGAKAIRGNHEEKEISQKTGEWTRFFKTLPYYIQTTHFLFVHAGVRPGITLERQKYEDLLTIREPFFNAAIPVKQTIVFGHTPTNRLGVPAGSLWIQDNKIGIDTGAGKGEFLSLVDLTNQKQYRIEISRKKNKLAVLEW